jgi:hypothetical protein
MYFYCQSYLAFNFALGYPNSIIVSSQKEILKACAFLGKKCIEHSEFSLNDFLLKNQKVKAEIQRISNLIGPNELHFSHDQFALYCFALVQNQLSKNNKVTFHEFELKAKPIKQLNLKNRTIYFFITLLFRIFYQLNIQLRSTNNKTIILSLDISNLKSLRKVTYSEKKYNEIIEKNLRSVNINSDPIENLFIDQGLSNNPYLVNDQKQLVLLKNILNKHQFQIKEHPIHSIPAFFDEFDKLPNFLPVEIYFNTLKGKVISLFSHALIIASRFEDIQAISLLYLIEDTDLKNRMQQRLQEESENKITFVNSIDELKSLLN